MVSDFLPGNIIILGSAGKLGTVLLPPTIAALLVIVEPRLTLAVAGHSALVYLAHVSTSIVSVDPYTLHPAGAGRPCMPCRRRRVAGRPSTDSHLTSASSGRPLFAIFFTAYPQVSA